MFRRRAFDPETFPLKPIAPDAGNSTLVKDTTPETQPQLCEKHGTYFEAGKKCKKCVYDELAEYAEKRHPSGLPCAICGTTHSRELKTNYRPKHGNDGWEIESDTVPAWVMHSRSVNGKSMSVPYCAECERVLLRDHAPALGSDGDEVILDVRAGEITGAAQRWDGTGTYRVLHGLVRYLAHQTALHPGKRPGVACEQPGYGPTELTRNPLHFVPLNIVRAAAYRKDYGKLRVIPTATNGVEDENHPGTGTTIAWDGVVDEWRRRCWYVARKYNLDFDVAVDRLAAEGIEGNGLGIKMDAALREAVRKAGRISASEAPEVMTPPEWDEI